MKTKFHIPDVSTPVVLLRAVRHGGLCMMRSLGSAGVPVYIADSDRGSPAAASRYCKGFFPLDLDRWTEESILETLRGIATKIGCKAILLPTTDVAAEFVADHEAQLSENFLLASSTSKVVHGLASKRSMHELAIAAGIPTPQTRFPTGLEDLRRIATEVRYPVMLKSSDGQILDQTLRKTMVRVNSADELIATYQLGQGSDQSHVMVQEYIAGGEDTVWMFDGYFKDGERLFGITGKKIRQAPVYTGATCLGICVRNDTVDRLAYEFMRSVRYNGPVDMGFRYDALDGKYKVLDVNPRIGATFRLFVDDGDLDLARAIYLAATGQPVTMGTPRWGRKWLVEDNDMISSIRYFRDGKLTVREWLGSFEGVQEKAYLGHRDLRPALAILRRDMKELFRRVRNKILGKPSRTQPSPSSPVIIRPRINPLETPDPKRKFTEA
jgi:D-aspartate ligase